MVTPTTTTHAHKLQVCNFFQHEEHSRVRVGLNYQHPECPASQDRALSNIIITMHSGLQTLHSLETMQGHKNKCSKANNYHLIPDWGQELSIRLAADDLLACLFGCIVFCFLNVGPVHSELCREWKWNSRWPTMLLEHFLCQKCTVHHRGIQVFARPSMMGNAHNELLTSW